jgi:UDP-glucose 4-epimerase
VPQDPEYAGTTRLAKALAATEGKSLRTTRLFNPFIRVLVKYNKTMGKLFGSLVYQPDTKD